MSREFNEFKKRFPKLANELEQNEMRVKIDCRRSEVRNKKHPEFENESWYIRSLEDLEEKLN